MNADINSLNIFFFFTFRVLTRILKIGVKCCHPEKVGVLPYFSIETPKSWSQKWKVGVTYSKSGVNENSDFLFLFSRILK